ncbi:MAG: hypothetical protein J0I41_11755 [Filimonas sp.]|nr:hypothetical protein [Filimonas sp.]
MPIEIRELVIKATVSSAAPAGGGQQSNAAQSADDSKVQRILDEVLKKIKNKNER